MISLYFKEADNFFLYSINKEAEEEKKDQLQSKIHYLPAKTLKFFIIITNCGIISFKTGEFTSRHGLVLISINQT